MLEGFGSKNKLHVALFGSAFVLLSILTVVVLVVDVELPVFSESGESAPSQEEQNTSSVSQELERQEHLLEEQRELLAATQRELEREREESRRQREEPGRAELQDAAIYWAHKSITDAIVKRTQESGHLDYLHLYSIAETDEVSVFRDRDTFRIETWTLLSTVTPTRSFYEVEIRYLGGATGEVSSWDILRQEVVDVVVVR